MMITIQFDSECIFFLIKEIKKRERGRNLKKNIHELM